MMAEQSPELQTAQSSEVAETQGGHDAEARRDGIVSPE